MDNINVNIHNNCACNGSACPQELQLPGLLIPDMAYIVNAENGLVLTDFRGNVTQEEMGCCNSQVWLFERLESGAYDIINQQTGNALSLESLSTMDGVPIVTRTDVGNTIMQWRVITHIILEGNDPAQDLASGTLRLARQFVNVFSSKAITNPNGSTMAGTQMIQSTRLIFGAMDQLFTLQARSSS